MSRRLLGATGCCAPLPLRRTGCASCIGWTAAAGSMNGRSAGCPVMTTPRRCVPWTRASSRGSAVRHWLPGVRRVTQHRRQDFQLIHCQNRWRCAGPTAPADGSGRQPHEMDDAIGGTLRSGVAGKVGASLRDTPAELRGTVGHKSQPNPFRRYPGDRPKSEESRLSHLPSARQLAPDNVQRTAFFAWRRGARCPGGRRLAGMPRR
jgi:hypothetical protein